MGPIIAALRVASTRMPSNAGDVHSRGIPRNGKCGVTVCAFTYDTQIGGSTTVPWE